MFDSNTNFESTKNILVYVVIIEQIDIGQNINIHP